MDETLEKTAEPAVLEVPEELAGQRFDRTLAQLFPDYSRGWLQRAIRDGAATLDGRVVRPRDAVTAGATVVLTVQPAPTQAWTPQAIRLAILYEDDDIIVVDKPAGLVVHPGAGNADQTLANALLHHDPELTNIPRAGVVHRLDKDTSGLMVVARSLRAHTRLVAALSAHDVTREYLALVAGSPTAGGTIDAPLGRSRTHRTRMAVINGGKPARTHYRIAERFRYHTALALHLETGRTHQIRVHLTHIGYPIIGDRVYRGRTQAPSGTSPEVVDEIENLPRQALHARRLSFIHPGNEQQVEFESPLPDDIARVQSQLRVDAANGVR